MVSDLQIKTKKTHANYTTTFWVFKSFILFKFYVHIFYFYTKSAAMDFDTI